MPVPSCPTRPYFMRNSLGFMCTLLGLMRNSLGIAGVPGESTTRTTRMPIIRALGR